MTDAIQKAREALVAAREALRADNMFTLSVKIDAALAALDAETEVKVRALEWVEPSRQTNGCWTAPCIPASVPEDVAGVVERLRGYRPANEWGDPVQHTICDEAASALARVAKERDEARATLDEVCLSNRQEWQRATSAEAKLAEARKVIEPFANCAIDKADFPLGEDYEAARRFLEKTQPGATP